MRLAPAAALLCALALAACETPRESCISNASRHLHIIEALIVETQSNIERGFALDYDQEVSVRRGLCGHDWYDEDDGFENIICDRVYVDDVQRPVAIDLDAERAKLDSLLEQRETLVPRREAQVSACVATYPE